MQQPLFTDPNMKNEYTQTEEIFFKMHWSYFTGQYKILSCKSRGIISNNNNNYLNFFGQIKNRNIYNNNSLLNNKKQANLINSNYNKFNGKINYNNNNLNVVRSKSLSNRMIFSGKSITPGVSFNKNYNINNNVNNNNINNYYNKLINDNRINNYMNNNQNNIDNNANKEDNINNYKINNQNNIKIIKNKNDLSLNKKINIGKNQYSKSLVDKNQKKNLINNKENAKIFFNKTSSSLMNPFPSKQKKIINHNYNNNLKNNIKNGNEMENNENIIGGENKIYPSKFNEFNGFNKNIISKENIMNKMAKSSTSFYKH